MPLKFTIVIPTRERSETLRHSLRTCVEQSYDPLEIIVSDNASGDDTREVVRSFGDGRIRYVNTGRRCSMSQNWEFALQHVTGDYVTFIGDDDGLLPGAVAEVAALIAAHHASAVSWEKAEYGWPNHPQPEYRGLMAIPLALRLFVCDARTFARDAARLWTPLTRGPSLYNAFVSVSSVKSITAKTGGVFFHSVIPDAYSSAAIASAIPHYYFSSRPFSVNGASSRSNGANTESYLQRGRHAITETRTFVEEADLPLHPRMPVLIMGSSVALMLEALLQANDYCFNGSLPIDMDRATYRIAREVSTAQPARYESVRKQLEELALIDPRRQRVVRGALNRYPHRPAVSLAPRRGLRADDVFVTNVTTLGINDVHAAAAFVHGLIGPFAAPSTTARYSHYSKIVSRGFGAVRLRLDPHLW